MLSVAKTGGLADAVFGLVREIKKLGHDVRLLIPYYGHVAAKNAYAELHHFCNFKNVFPGIDVQILEGKSELGDIETLFIDHPIYADHSHGAIYVNDQNMDWPDSHIRFGLLNKVAAMIADENSSAKWKPDILHLHDWCTALTSVYVRLNPRIKARTVLTIHNLAFQGIFDLNVLPQLTIPQDIFDSGDLKLWDQLSWLKGGICFSDVVTTVSPTYRNNILNHEHGSGLEQVIQSFHPNMPGILLGVCQDIWNPRDNKFIFKILTIEICQENSPVSYTYKKNTSFQRMLTPFCYQR